MIVAERNNVELKIGVMKQQTGEYREYFTLGIGSDDDIFTRDKSGNLTYGGKMALNIKSTQIEDVINMFKEFDPKKLKDAKLDAIKLEIEKEKSRK